LGCGHSRAPPRRCLQPVRGHRALQRAAARHRGHQ